MYYKMLDYKKVSPSVNLLVAQYLGYRAPSEEKGDLGDLLRMFPGGEVT